MAYRVGVTKQTIIAIENDRYNPTLELAMKLAQLLNTPVEEIFQLDNNSKKALTDFQLKARNDFERKGVMTCS